MTRSLHGWRWELELEGRRERTTSPHSLPDPMTGAIESCLKKYLMCLGNDYPVTFRKLAFIIKEEFPGSLAVKEPAWSLLWPGFNQSLAQELPHAHGCDPPPPQKNIKADFPSWLSG